MGLPRNLSRRIAVFKQIPDSPRTLREETSHDTHCRGVRHPRGRGEQDVFFFDPQQAQLTAQTRGPATRPEAQAPLDVAAVVSRTEHTQSLQRRRGKPVDWAGLTDLTSDADHRSRPLEGGCVHLRGPGGRFSSE